MKAITKAITKAFNKIFGKRENIVVYRDGKVYKCRTFLEAFEDLR